MHWAFLTIGTIAIVELLLRLPIADRAQQALAIAQKALKTVSSNAISDHWKERVLPVYAGKLFVASLSIFALLVLALSPLAVLALIAFWLDVPLLAFLMDYRGMLASLIIACGYLVLRNRFRYV